MPIFKKRKSNYLAEAELKEKWWHKSINSLNIVFSFIVFSYFLVNFFDDYSRSILLSLFFSIFFALISFLLVWFIYRKIIILIIFGKKPENFEEETVLVTKKPKTNWNYLFLIIIFSFLIIITLLILQNYYQIEPNINYNKNDQKIEHKIEDWLVYENTESSYQVKYPETWEVNEQEKNRVLFYLEELKSENIKMLINIQGYQFFNEETIKEINEDKYIIHIEEVIVNGQAGHKLYRQKDEQERDLIFYTIPKDEFVFIILIYELSLVDLIISNFEFLE